MSVIVPVPLVTVNRSFTVPTYNIIIVKINKNDFYVLKRKK